MKRARKTFKAIFAVLLVGVVISVSSWAFAQGGGISGCVKDLSNNQGIDGVIITVKDVSTSAVAGTGNTDALGNYSVSTPSPGNYTLVASKSGYDNMTAPDVIELSDMNPNRTVNISMGREAWLKEKPEETTQAMSWETGTGKSYLIPALEIPAFLLLLNVYDRLAYPNDVEGRGKSLRNEPVNLLGPRRPRALGDRRGCLCHFLWETGGRSLGRFGRDLALSKLGPGHGKRHDLFHFRLALLVDIDRLDCPPSFKVSLNMLRFRQILRPNESFHTSLLFSPINLTTYY